MDLFIWRTLRSLPGTPDCFPRLSKTLPPGARLYSVICDTPRVAKLTERAKRAWSKEAMR
jgi:hypothetical protein